MLNKPSVSLILQTFDDVKDMEKSCDKKLTYKILRQNFNFLEEQSLRFHQAIKEILEQIAFHRESIQGRGQKSFGSRIRNFHERMEEFNEEYKRILREPKMEKIL